MNQVIDGEYQNLPINRTTLDPSSSNIMHVNTSTVSMKPKRKLPDFIYKHLDDGVSDRFYLGTTGGKEKVKCTFLILSLFLTNLMLNCSYGICAPFLPMMADEHEIDQSYLGIMFCVYSISMAIISPFVGKYQYLLGRRNMARWGMIIVGIPFLGFYGLNYKTTPTFFMWGFIAMRVIQGVGTSMVQTSAYSMLTLTYPDHIR